MFLARWRSYESPHRAGRDPAIHKKRLPGNIAAGFRSKENYSRIKIVWLARPSYRNAVAEIFHPLFVLIQHVVLRGMEPPRGKAVHGHPMTAPVVRQAH